jgi:nitrate reductase gamma subunit
MKLVLSVLAIIVLALVPWVGVSTMGLHTVFGVVLPYLAIAIFLIGFVWRIIDWARSPVPFRIPTTCGQQKSHAWIKQDRLENPDGFWSTAGRMLLEVLFFRSLFRNTKADIKEGSKLVYGSSKWLWAIGLAFHYAFLVIFLRHFKYFAEPTPDWVLALQWVDSFWQVGVPLIYMTDLILVGAVSLLFIRRLWNPQVRYISLAADYFPLLLILGIGISGIWMRYFSKTDLLAVKQLGTGLISFSPAGADVLSSIGVVFFIHLFLVCCLFIYFPFSKLMHLGGVFLSPTRNLANNNRVKRHINPWNPEVKFHTYDEYEDEFRDVMKAAGLPVEKE